MKQLSNKNDVALKQAQTFHLWACRLFRMMAALFAEYGGNWQHVKVMSWNRNFLLQWCWILLFSVNLKEAMKLTDRQMTLFMYLQIHTCQTGQQSKKRAGVCTNVRVVTTQSMRYSLNKEDMETTWPEKPSPQLSAAATRDSTTNPAADQTPRSITAPVSWHRYRSAVLKHLQICRLSLPGFLCSNQTKSSRVEFTLKWNSTVWTARPNRPLYKWEVALRCQNAHYRVSVSHWLENRSLAARGEKKQTRQTTKNIKDKYRI